MIITGLLKVKSDAFHAHCQLLQCFHVLCIVIYMMTAINVCVCRDSYRNFGLGGGRRDQVHVGGGGGGVEAASPSQYMTPNKHI